MADITVEGSVVTGNARSIRNVVFTTEAIGYFFFIDSDDDLFYVKTTDGGASWGSPVEIDTDTTIVAFALDVYYDRWTPGDTGTKIHIAWLTSDDGDVNYRTLDTNGDTLGTQRLVFDGASAVAGRGTFVSIAKTVSGYLYVAYDIDAGAERGLHRSTDAGATWSANLSTTFVEATLDICILFPAMNTGDGNDCWAVYHDADVNLLTLKMWDSSAGAQAESATIQTHIEGTTDLTGQIGFSAAIRHRDGHLILSSISERDAATGDHQMYDITSTASFVALGSITTNIDDHYNQSLFIDQRNDALYVVYSGKRDGSEVLGTTTKVYYTKSLDNGMTWTAGDTAYMEGATAAVAQVWCPPMGPRFYAAWRVGTTIIANKVNSVKMDVFDDVRAAIIAGIDSAQAEGTGWDALRSTIAASSVVRTSDRVVTITLPAIATYDITAQETLTATVPASALQTEASEVASPTFTIDTALDEIEGTLSKTLGAITLVATGTSPITGTASVTLGAVTLSSTGTVDVTGTASVTLGAVTLSATATAEAQGSLNTSVGAITVAAAGTVENPDLEGELTVTLGEVTLAATGTVDARGSLSTSIGVIALAAAGTADVAGALSASIGTITLTSTGTADVQGTLSRTIGTIALSATATSDIAGVLSSSIGSIAFAAEGIVGDAPVEGSLAVTLGAVTLSATGTAEARGTLTATIGTITLSAAGAAEIRGTASITLGAITSTATGSSDISGTLTATLGEITLAAAAGAEVQGQLALSIGLITLVAFEQAPWIYGDRVFVLNITLTAAGLSGVSATVPGSPHASLTPSGLDDVIAA